MIQMEWIPIEQFNDAHIEDGVDMLLMMGNVDEHQFPVCAFYNEQTNAFYDNCLEGPECLARDNIIAYAFFKEPEKEIGSVEIPTFKKRTKEDIEKDIRELEPHTLDTFFEFEIMDCECDSRTPDEYLDCVDEVTSRYNANIVKLDRLKTELRIWKEENERQRS